MVYNCQALINQFANLKKESINDTVSWQNSSDQVQKISALLHKFYLNEVRSLPDYPMIEGLLQSALVKILAGHQLSITAKLELQYNDLQNVKIIPLYTPAQLATMLQEQASENEQNLLELFLSQSDTWLSINLGLFLQT